MVLVLLLEQFGVLVPAEEGEWEFEILCKKTREDKTEKKQAEERKDMMVQR